ncbi:cupin domain-containing protein [Ramlibacter sp.]|uniref:cupin domain-containing protein n=1 Tax=Ramlibacter sp. TaxID=1917967 RepID=UPI0017E8C1DD|nr:cupin domain-containing protein [Ramlibacter sp.]MBA2675912.1 cupin domain-containing protein [Ramlibacter sp.]
MTEPAPQATRPWDSAYRISNTTVLAENPTLRVLDMTLLPGESVPWHLHPDTDDLFVGLVGEFDVFHGPQAACTTVRAPGRHLVPKGETHTVRNRSGAPCQFLLIQDGGPYQFIATQGAAAA